MMKPTCCPVPGACDEVMAPDDYSMPPEEFLDRNFGRGTWVRDPYDDCYVVWDGLHRGPGRAYFVIDRSLRRTATVIPSNRLN
jgi:hypothetical protein